MTDFRTKLGHGLAKGLGIKLDYRSPTGPKLTRGESVFSVASADSYTEDEPSSLEWIKDQFPTGKEFVHYLHNLIPFTKWIHRYNLQWLAGDLVAGITIGAVVVPQGMAYAELAELPVEYGLYSSFMGVLIYWFFATSKDITIGVSTISLIESRSALTSFSLSLSCPPSSETSSSKSKPSTPNYLLQSSHLPWLSSVAASLLLWVCSDSVGSSTSSLSRQFLPS